MRKLILMLAALSGFVLSSFAQVETYTASAFTMHYDGKWWPWEPNDCVIEVDYDNDIVTIHSYIPQIYTISGELEQPLYQDGKRVAYTCSNQDGEYFLLRFTVLKNGKRAVYIDSIHENITSVYTIVWQK